MVNRTTKTFTIIIFTAIAAITLGNSISEKLFAALELPNPIEDWEIEIILNNYQMQQVWKAQDSIRKSWSTYSDSRELLLKELIVQLYLENLSNENLINTALDFRKQFWQEGAKRPKTSFRYAYMARILLEQAQSREPENLLITDELIETIQSTDTVWIFKGDSYEKSDNIQTLQLLSKIRSAQFEQIKTEVEKGRIPDWDDFVRANDLIYLLGKSKDYESAKKVTEWLISNSDRGQWTAYLDILEKLLTGIEKESVLKFNIYIASKADFSEEFEYTRRLPSFKGPDREKRGIIAVHKNSTNVVWKSK